MHLNQWRKWKAHPALLLALHSADFPGPVERADDATTCVAPRTIWVRDNPLIPGVGTQPGADGPHHLDGRLGEDLLVGGSAVGCLAEAKEGGEGEEGVEGQLHLAGTTDGYSGDWIGMLYEREMSLEVDGRGREKRVLYLSLCTVLLVNIGEYYTYPADE